MIPKKELVTRLDYCQYLLVSQINYTLTNYAERTEKRSGVPITELRVAGGGSQSDAALQLTADIFGLPASCPHLYEASALGAAIDAAVGVGIHKDFSTAIREMTRVRDTFEPDAKTHARYNELYHGVYKNMYSRLKPLYEFMRNVGKR